MLSSPAACATIPEFPSRSAGRDPRFYCPRTIPPKPFRCPENLPAADPCSDRIQPLSFLALVFKPGKFAPFLPFGAVADLVAFVAQLFNPRVVLGDAQTEDHV